MGAIIDTLSGVLFRGAIKINSGIPMSWNKKSACNGFNCLLARAAKKNAKLSEITDRKG